MNLAPPSPPAVLFLQPFQPCLLPVTLVQRIRRRNKGRGMGLFSEDFYFIFSQLIDNPFIFPKKTDISRSFNFFTSFVILHHLSSSVIIFHLHNHGLSLLLNPDALAQAWSPYPWFPEPRRGWRQTRKPKQSQPTDKPYDLYYEKWNKRWGTEVFTRHGQTNMFNQIKVFCVYKLDQPATETCCSPFSNIAFIL